MRSGRLLTAGSSVLAALVVLYVYWRFEKVPLLDFAVAPAGRLFLLVFPALASCGLWLWGVASFRLKARIWRYGLSVLSALASLGCALFVIQAVARGEVGQPWVAPVAFMPVVLLGMLTWILWTKRTSFRWGRVVVYLVAVLLVFAPPVAFLARAESLEAGLKHLGLALVPFGLVVLGTWMGKGRPGSG